VTDPGAGKLTAVLAHPDDEMGFAPVLAHYAARGAEVRLVCVTSGQKGFRSHTEIRQVEKLVEVREAELREASRILGLEPPVLLGFVDQELWGGKQEEVRRALAGTLESLDPQVVLTFGPDGVTGHPDHRAVSCFVTEILQARRQPDVRLYYHALTLEDVDRFARRTGRRLLGVADPHLTTRIRVSPEELDRGLRAVGQYRSQFAPEVMEELQEVFRANGTEIWFRRVLPGASPAQPVEESLFGEAAEEG